MKKILTLFFISMSLFAQIASAEQVIYYTGESISIPVKKDKQYEIILPEPFVNWSSNIDPEKWDEYFKYYVFDGKTRFFVKFLKDDEPIKFHFWGGITDKTYVIKTDFLSTDKKDDDVYRIASDVYTKENKKNIANNAELTYSQRAIGFGNDMRTRNHDSFYSVTRNINKEIMKQVPTFKFTLKDSYNSGAFVGFIISVENNLDVAQPFNEETFYMPGLVTASIDRKILAPRPKTSRAYFKKEYKTTLYLVFDPKNKEFKKRVFDR